MARVSPGNHLSCRVRGSAVGPRRNPTKTRVLLSRAWPARVSPTFSMGKPDYFSRFGAGLGAVKLYLESGLVAAARGPLASCAQPAHPAPPHGVGGGISRSEGFGSDILEICRHWKICYLSQIFKNISGWQGCSGEPFGTCVIGIKSAMLLRSPSAHVAV